MSEEKNHPQLEKKLKQQGIAKRMPIFLGDEGKEVWITYEIIPEETLGTCSVCKKANQKIVKEKVKGDPEIDSKDPEIIAEARDAIRKLVDLVEEKMCVCENCYNDDFISKKPLRYVDAMKEAAEELGIKIDLEGLEKAVIGAK